LGDGPAEALAGDERVEPDDEAPRRRQLVPEAVREVVAPRRDLQLEQVREPDETADAERAAVEEVDDADLVARVLEPLAQLVRRTAVPRAHRGGEDQDSPGHRRR